MDVATAARFSRVLDHAQAYAPDAYFFTGDFCAREPQSWVYEELAPRLAALRAPTVIIPGNHDSRPLMRQYFDLPGSEDEPILQDLTLAGQTFLFLDTRFGILEDSQLNWLTSKLEHTPEAHLVMHHPPVKMGVAFMDDNYALRDTDRLLDLMHARERTTHVFCGHYHSGRTVYDANLAVHLCPPTSFFIKPEAVESRAGHAATRLPTAGVVGRRATPRHADLPGSVGESPIVNAAQANLGTPNPEHNVQQHIHALRTQHPELMIPSGGGSHPALQ